MGTFSPLHWIVVLVVVILIFGTKKLGNIGSDLGRAVKGFKDGLKTEEEKSTDFANKPIAQHPADSVIDVKAKEKI